MASGVVRGRAQPGLCPEPPTSTSVLPRAASLCSVMRKRKTARHVGRSRGAGRGPRDAARPSRGHSAPSSAHPGPAPGAAHQPGAPCRPPGAVPRPDHVPSPRDPWERRVRLRGGKAASRPARLTGGSGPETAPNASSLKASGNKRASPLGNHADGRPAPENPLRRSRCVLPASAERPAFFQSTKPHDMFILGNPFAKPGSYS